MTGMHMLCQIPKVHSSNFGQSYLGKSAKNELCVFVGVEKGCR